MGKDHPQGLLLQQAIGEGLSAGSSFAASYWGRTIRRVFFCSKLLGKDHPQGLLLQQALGESPFVGLFFPASYWANQICNLLLWGLFLQQAIGYVLVLGFLLFGYWGKDHLQGLLLQQVIGEIPFVGPSRLTLRLGKDHLQGLLLQQAIGEIPFVGLFFQQAIGQNSCVIPFIIYIIYNI